MAIDRQQLRRVQGRLSRYARNIVASSGPAQTVRAGQDEQGPEKMPQEGKTKPAKNSAEQFFDPNPSIAIVVPARNEGRFLRPCLRSIREQFFNSWEAIVIDDGSTDDTRKIADEFAGKDARIRVVSHIESLGLAAARNTGIELTNAPFITFLDADDFLYQHSLNSRLKAILAADSEYVAGSYCDWQATAEDQGRRPPKRPPADKPKVVGFPGGPECPFIATAPLIRRDVIERLGGFNEALPTAEDFDLWVRALRDGYTFVYAKRIGVAYRQKASGMVFTDTALHARASADIIEAQYRDLSQEANPPAFSAPVSEYSRDLVTARRLLRSFGLSEVVAGGSDQAAIGAMMPPSLQLLSRAGLDVRFELNAGLSRAAKAVPSLKDPEIRRRTLDKLEERLFAADFPEQERPASLAGRTGSLHSSERVSKRSLSAPADPVLVRTSTKKSELGIVFVPMARYHALEMKGIAEKLRIEGQDSTFLIAEQFQGSVMDVLADADCLFYDDDPKALPSFDGVYMMNDWGMTREIILEARIRDVPTFARVEGVQDYRDVDTGRIRLPYQTADYILAQGQNDISLVNPTRVRVVGNSRLESLLRAPERTSDSATGRAVINSNFTYGVMTEQRDQFVKSSIRACLDAGLEPVVSQHPADKELPVDLGHYRSMHSMSDLLHTCDVLITRFSTVPFEAMAVGTPFVYFRPIEEKVATFNEPKGAFEIVQASSALADSLRRAVRLLGSYRLASESFFRDQCDVGKVSSDRRAADVILEVVNA